MGAADERRRTSHRGRPLPAAWRRAACAAAALLALAPQPVAAEAPRPLVAGVSSLGGLAAWAAARADAAGRRVGELDAAEGARAAEQALATGRLAAALQRNGALLAAKRALEADAGRARAGRDEAEAVTRRLDRAVTSGLVALAARGRPDVQPARRVARMRAVVAGLLEPYAAKARLGQALDSDAARLGGEARRLDAPLAALGASLAVLDGRLRAAREAALAVRRERGEALARRDALGRLLAAIEERGRAAAELSGPSSSAARSAAARMRRGRDPGPLLVAGSLAGERGPRSLLAGARAAPPRPAAARLDALAFGNARLVVAAAPAIPAVAGPLFAPIAGRPVTPVGGDGQLFRRGLLLETGVAQTVSAPCRGDVVFAERFGGFGLLLIIDRGDGYHALLSGFSRLDVGRGASVMAGQAVGAIGVGDGAARLYVELRRRGSPVDPSAWPALREDKVRS